MVDFNNLHIIGQVDQTSKNATHKMTRLITAYTAKALWLAVPLH